MLICLLLHCSKMIEEFKKDMVKKYEMGDMGLLYYFLGIEVYQDK
jgi:hypothetical protein